MRRIMIEIILVLVLVLGYGGAKSVAQEMISKGEETSEVNKLIGKSIKTTQGEDLGIITDVVAGPEDRAAFLVLNYWISDDTQERVAIPFGALSCEKQDGVLKVSKDALDSAPTFVSKDDLGEPELAEDIYRYFGIQPYWTEEGSSKK